MTTVWQVQEAKNRFSEMIEQTLSQGPQVITRHGRAVVRVVAAVTGEDVAASAAVPATVQSTPQATAQPDGFAQYLLSVPRADDFPLPVRRSRKHPVQLGG